MTVFTRQERPRPSSTATRNRPRASKILRAGRSSHLSRGTPLDRAERSHFEQVFQHDFANVRVHADTAADRESRRLEARAFTVGEDIVLAAGEGRLDTSRGRILLAHELAHVVQQRLGRKSTNHVGRRDDASEREAEHAARAFRWSTVTTSHRVVASDLVWEHAPRPRSARPVLSPARAGIQRIELTYDDGPDTAGNTAAVLKALNAAGARATFYLVGKRVAQGDNWRMVFEIAAAGHWLGNHAYDWNDATDNHVFLHGTVEERANKILQTEWVIRDALIRGRADAKAQKTWDAIPKANRDYIEEVIARGTGRFRTPGFKSHGWTGEGLETQAAMASVNVVLAATGLRPLVVTEAGLTSTEGVTVDPEDWRHGRTQGEIESGVTGKLSSAKDTILLHSRIAATAAATPAIVADIKKRGWAFEPTVRGEIGSIGPKAPFAGLGTISDPPTSQQIDAARASLRKMIPSYGPVLCAGVAIGILQLAQRAGPAEVDAFVAEIRTTTVETVDPSGLRDRVKLANWLNASEEWRLFSGFFENWVLQKPFPRIKGVTL